MCCVAGLDIRYAMLEPPLQYGLGLCVSKKAVLTDKRDDISCCQLDANHGRQKCQARYCHQPYSWLNAVLRDAPHHHQTISSVCNINDNASIAAWLTKSHLINRLTTQPRTIVHKSHRLIILATKELQSPIAAWENIQKQTQRKSDIETVQYHLQRGQCFRQHLDPRIIHFTQSPQ